MLKYGIFPQNKICIGHMLVFRLVLNLFINEKTSSRGKPNGQFNGGYNVTYTRQIIITEIYCYRRISFFISAHSVVKTFELFASMQTAYLKLSACV